jgi:hypothetical protein
MMNPIRAVWLDDLHPQYPNDPWKEALAQRLAASWGE